MTLQAPAEVWVEEAQHVLLFLHLTMRRLIFNEASKVTTIKRNRLLTLWS